MDTAELALLVSVVSLVISFTALLRDRHVVRARAVAFGRPEKWNLSVTVINSGKRPISITNVTIRPPDSPGISRGFLHNGSAARIEVGASASTEIMPGDPLYCWGSDSPYHYEITVEDAIGKTYKAKFPRGAK
jgi:hypothetical protein